MGASVAAIARAPGDPFPAHLRLELFLYRIGPNATTFVYPVEIFPVETRTTGHGIASASGKIGAFVGVFLFSFLMHWNGLFTAESLAAIICLLGLITTLIFLPETKGKSLEEMSGEK